MADAARQSTVLKGSFSAPEEFWGFAQQETDDSVSFVSPREWERHNCPLEYQGWRLLPPLHLNPPFPSLRKLKLFLSVRSPKAGQLGCRKPAQFSRVRKRCLLKFVGAACHATVSVRSRRAGGAGVSNRQMLCQLIQSVYFG